MSSAVPPVFSRVTAAAILTGGRARRLHGRDKSRLVVDPGGPSILDQQLAVLAPIASETLIITSAARARDFAKAGVRVVLDDYPECGPLGAVATALNSMAADALIVIAGDMPHVSRGLLKALVDLHHRNGTQATVPEGPRGLEPLCAIYDRSARQTLARALESGDLSLHHALHQLRVGIMDAAGVAAFGDPATLFRNINTPEDLS